MAQPLKPRLYTYGPLISADGSRAVCTVQTNQSDLVVATGLIPE